jgi:uncharacterized membrane protein
VPVIDQLSRTRPWVLLFAILGTIGMVFMVIATLGMLFGAAAAPAAPGMPRGMMGMLALIYAASVILYVFPIISLYRYAARIGRLRESGNSDFLVSALDAQRGFWKSMGIAFILFMVLYVIMMIFMVVGVAGQMQTMQPPGGAVPNWPPAAPAGN